MHKPLVNALLFLSGGCACLFAAHQSWLLLVPLLALLVHCLWISSWAAEGRLVASVMLFGAVGGSLSYLAGSKLADVSFPLGQTPTLLLLALIWAGVFPLLHSQAQMYRDRLR